MKIITTNNFSSLLSSVFARRSKCSIYRHRGNSPEDEQVAEIWGSEAPDLPQICGLDWVSAAQSGPLDLRFLLRICYEVVIHVAFWNLQLLRGSLWILISNLGFILGLKLNSLIIAN